jgi:hypothetical protein
LLCPLRLCGRPRSLSPSCSTPCRASRRQRWRCAAPPQSWLWCRRASCSVLRFGLPRSCPAESPPTCPQPSTGTRGGTAKRRFVSGKLGDYKKNSPFASNHAKIPSLLILPSFPPRSRQADATEAVSRVKFKRGFRPNPQLLCEKCLA